MDRLGTVVFCGCPVRIERFANKLTHWPMGLSVQSIGQWVYRLAKDPQPVGQRVELLANTL